MMKPGDDDSDEIVGKMVSLGAFKAMFIGGDTKRLVSMIVDGTRQAEAACGLNVRSKIPDSHMERSVSEVVKEKSPQIPIDALKIGIILKGEKDETRKLSITLPPLAVFHGEQAALNDAAFIYAAMNYYEYCGKKFLPIMAGLDVLDLDGKRHTVLACVDGRGVSVVTDMEEGKTLDQASPFETTCLYAVCGAAVSGCPNDKGETWYGGVPEESIKRCIKQAEEAAIKISEEMKREFLGGV